MGGLTKIEALPGLKLETGRMKHRKRPQKMRILITNDDGIEAPRDSDVLEKIATTSPTTLIVAPETDRQ